MPKHLHSNTPLEPKSHFNGKILNDNKYGLTYVVLFSLQNIDLLQLNLILIFILPNA